MKNGSVNGRFNLNFYYLKTVIKSKCMQSIGHVLNEKGTGYEYSISTEMKNGTCHLKEQWVTGQIWELLV